MKLHNENSIIIAIDGPSASGKGTIARKLAAHFGFAHLDTGLLYRAVGFAVMSAGGDPADAELAEEAALALAAGLMGNTSHGVARPSLTLPARGKESTVLSAIDFTQLMKNDVLRSDEVSSAASKVAAVPAVRAALLKFQKDFCAAPPDGVKGVVLDGRDIGTVIAPEAQVKIFVTASAEARAERRFRELQSRGLTASYEAVLSDMKARDARDAERVIAPSKPAPDAVVLDTTVLTAAEALGQALEIVTMAGI